ncbi:MAG: insulinase family protein, partial [Opitutales bacterium]|nr:insulinase family protein [Opitutales bacterium]
MALSQLTLATPKLEQDPALATERLANGMEIAVFKNSEPPNRVSMRLLVRRGSLCETESERGLAHFMEHMAFNGTKHFPAGEMVEYFQRLGMAFGADTNAHTGFTETVYKIDMPEASEKLIDDGMTLFRDYCDAMLLAPEEIEKERGVILAEKNSRDTQEYRKVVKEIAHIYKGSAFADKMPIGVESVIKNAKRGDFQKFYAAAYRPENAVLVVAGDVEPKKILEMARKRFEGFKASESQPARKAEFGSLEKSAGAFPFDGKAPEIDALYDCTENSPRAYASISVSKEKAGEKDSLERRARLFRLKALASALTSRFLRTASLPDSKITQGDASIFEFDSFCETFSVSAEAPVGGAFDALEEALRQILDAENLAEHEIEDAKMKIVDELKSAVKAAPTRKSSNLANAVVACLSKGKVFNSPQNGLEIAMHAFEGFGAKEAVGLLKEALSCGKIKAFISDAKKCGEGELGEKVSQAFESASKSRRGAGAFARARLKFSRFGAEGKIAERREIASLGITQLRFENGVRLNFKKTDFSKDEILVKVSFGKGILDIPADKPELYCAVDAVRTGGTKFQSAGEIDAAKYLMKTSDAMGIDGNAFTYSTAVGCAASCLGASVGL